MADLNEVDSMSTELESRLDDLFNENDIRLPDSPEQDSKGYYPLAELKSLILSIDWEITDEILEHFLQQLKDLKIMYAHDKIVLAFLQILNSLGDYIKTNRAKSHPKTFKILNSVFSSLDKVVLSRDMAETAKKKILLAEINRYKKLRAHVLQSRSTPQQKAAAVTARTKAPRIERTEEPESTATEPSVPKPELSEEKSPVAAIAETPRIERTEEPESGATEPSAPTPELSEDKSPVAEQRQEPSVVSLPEPSVATLSEAVQEIKRYIHNEIKALKEEIKSLRDRK